MVERLFLAVPRGCLQFVIVVFPDHTHLLFSNGFLNELVDHIMRDWKKKLFCENAKNTIICPSVQTDPSSFRYMVTLISKYSMYNLSKSLPIPCSFIHPSLSLSLATSLVI